MCTHGCAVLFVCRGIAVCCFTSTACLLELLSPGEVERIATDGIVDFHKQRDVGEIVKEFHHSFTLMV